jgi:cytochrome c peroxidase
MVNTINSIKLGQVILVTLLLLSPVHAAAQVVAAKAPVTTEQATKVVVDFIAQAPVVKRKRTNVPAKVATVLAKCSDCHTYNTKFPFYADFPIVRDLIQHDIDEGRRYFNIETEIFLKRDKNGLKIDEIPIATLNRIENVVLANSMPPIQYRIIHWDKTLTANDKEVLLKWVRNLRGDIVKALPNPDELGLDPNKLVLGEKLFHDTRLSGDDTISCASCHDLAKGGTDQSQFSTGIKGNKGHINSPTVYNSVYNFKQFWDGRADDLAAQASGPVHNPIEMGAGYF